MISRRKRSEEDLLPKNAKELLPKILLKLEKKYRNNSINIIESWPEIVGSRLAPMTKVIGFDDGILTVKVKNSTLFSLLNNYEKDKILLKLQTQFSDKIIKKLCFKLG